MKHQNILQNFLISYIYIYFCHKTSPNQWWLSHSVNDWDEANTFTCDIIYFVEEGGFLLTVDGKTHHVKAGQMVYLPAGTYFERKICEEKLVKFYTHADLSFGRYRINEIFRFPYVCTVRNPKEAAERFEALRRSGNKDTILSVLDANADFLKLVCYFLEESEAVPILKTEKDFTLQSTVQYINSNLHRTITVKELATLSGYSTAHFTRKFKRQFGKLPLSYIADIKVSAAKKRLRDTDLSVTAIAEEVGYTDVSLFGQHFKKRVGATPTTYRKKRMWKV